MVRILCTFVLYGCCTLKVHSQIFCVPDTQFDYPEIALRANLTPSFSVKFDVIAFAPQNIQISPLDNSSTSFVQLFTYSIFENLHKLIYLKDSNGVRLKVRYQIRESGLLNSRYATITSEDELQIVVPQPNVQASIGDGPIKQNFSIDSVCLDDFVTYKSGIAYQSDITVQRLYSNDNDSTMILRNNYPSMENEIYSQSKQYSKQLFLDYAPNAKTFFIRFHVRRYLPECHCQQIF